MLYHAEIIFNEKRHIPSPKLPTIPTIAMTPLFDFSPFIAIGVRVVDRQANRRRIIDANAFQ